jgi:hypothetical protein
MLHGALRINTHDWCEILLAMEPDVQGIWIGLRVRVAPLE